MFNETEKKIIAFRDARDWSQFHNPRTLSTSISIESAELLELFQWAKDSELQALASRKKGEISQELAYIMIYTMMMAHDRTLTLSGLFSKIMKNIAIALQATQARNPPSTELSIIFEL